MSEEHQRELDSDDELSNSEVSEVFDEQGDVRLLAGSKRFLVSSKCLSLASPTFKRMFYDSNFLEAQTSRSPDKPLEISLEDDDPQALEILLNVIHFSSNQSYNNLDPEQLLQVAKLADKYFCTHVIKYQARVWLDSLKTQELDMSSLWKLCGVTYLMGFEADFARNASTLSLQASSFELDSLEDLVLPVDTTTWSTLIAQTKFSIMQSLIGEVEEKMRVICLGLGHFYSDDKICPRCKRCKPLQTKTSHQCAMELFSSISKFDHCVGLPGFYAELQRCDIWPLVFQMYQSPLAFLQKFCSRPRKHECEGKDQCPLMQDFNTLEVLLQTKVANKDLIGLESLNRIFPRGKSIATK